MNTNLRIEAITPIFSYGTGREQPEIRPSSIRGQLRWWLETLGHSKEDIDAIFGTIAGNSGEASKVIVRVADIEATTGESRLNAHKRNWSPEPALVPGAQFTLSISDRRSGLDSAQEQTLQKALDAWLTLGTLGRRATRGSCSVQSADAKETESSWKQRTAELLEGTGCQLILGGTAYAREEDARKVICDTLAPEAFGRHDPLGYAKGQNRKSSRLRMRVQRFADADRNRPYRISALWLGGEGEPPLPSVLDTLANGGRSGQPKRIGEELQAGEVVVA
mgnify:CR=1 FL=1